MPRRQRPPRPCPVASALLVRGHPYACLEREGAAAVGRKGQRHVGVGQADEFRVQDQLQEDLKRARKWRADRLCEWLCTQSVRGKKQPYPSLLHMLEHRNAARVDEQVYLLARSPSWQALKWLEKGAEAFA